MSFNRAPAAPSDATRGNASYVPFLPGSFSLSQKNKNDDILLNEGMCFR